MHRPRHLDMYVNKIQAATRRIVEASMAGAVVFCTANAFGSALSYGTTWTRHALCMYEVPADATRCSTTAWVSAWCRGGGR